MKWLNCTLFFLHNTILGIFPSLPCVHHQTIDQNVRIPVYEEIEIGVQAICYVPGVQFHKSTVINFESAFNSIPRNPTIPVPKNQFSLSTCHR